MLWVRYVVSCQPDFIRPEGKDTHDSAETIWARRSVRVPVGWHKGIDDRDSN